jgi:hypothetical protein
MASQEAFVTGRAPDPPLCEKINDTLGISINVKKPSHTIKIPYDIRQANH